MSAEAFTNEDRNLWDQVMHERSSYSDSVERGHIHEVVKVWRNEEMKASYSGGVEVWKCGDVEHRGVEKAGTRTTMWWWMIV